MLTSANSKIKETYWWLNKVLIGLLKLTVSQLHVIKSILCLNHDFTRLVGSSHSLSRLHCAGTCACYMFHAQSFSFIMTSRDLPNSFYLILQRNDMQKCSYSKKLLTFRNIATTNVYLFSLHFTWWIYMRRVTKLCLGRGKWHIVS